MKRSANIKDSIMMPPPKARPKSRSDTSEELRKNLTESVKNTSDNSAMQEEFSKFFRENEELEIRKMDDELSMSRSTSSANFQGVNSNQGTQLVCMCNNNNYNNNSNSTSNTNNIPTNPLCQFCLQSSLRHAFNFNLIHYDYNYTQFSDDEENVDSQNSVEKLRRNLIEEKETTKQAQHIVNLNPISTFSKSSLFKNFVMLPPPKDKKEVKLFVNNMLSYICDHDFDSSLLILKIKIQTRHNDFKNKGLKFDYYRDSLMKMQRELISKICLFNENEKKVDNGTYEMMKKKRKRSHNSKSSSCDESELSNDSNVSSCSNKSPNSSKSIKKRKKTAKKPKSEEGKPE